MNYTPNTAAAAAITNTTTNTTTIFDMYSTSHYL